MHWYRCYGLLVHAALPLPEFVEAGQGRADVVIRYASLPAPARVEGRYQVTVTGTDLHYYMPGVGGMCVRDGREILIDPVPGAEAQGFRFLVEGIGFGVLLHQRGVLALHASAVALPEGVVAFLGHKGAGKSTTAAVLHAAGHPVVTDDLLVLDPDGGQVIPGTPHLKLWPEALDAVFDEVPEPLPRIHPAVTKRQRAGTGTAARLPLRALYVLDFGDGPTTIAPLAPREATLELIRHSFALRFLKEAGVTSTHFAQAAQLARRVPVRRLTRTPALAGLPALARRIEDDLAVTAPKAD